MKIVTISDTHGQHRYLTKNNKLPEGDLIIHAGDCTGRGSTKNIEEFVEWYGSLDYSYKILIAGNHDWGFEKNAVYCKELCDIYGIIYLYDNDVKIEGIKIWGSPVQPEFLNWAFNRTRTLEEAAFKQMPWIAPHWKKIPNDVDMVITHGPAYGYLDRVTTPFSPNQGQHVGCEILKNRLLDIKPKMHICGHIHEGRGVYVEKNSPSPITFVNTSTLDARYKFYQENVYRFDWDKVVCGESQGND